jgi:hypothetical protein
VIDVEIDVVDEEDETTGDIEEDDDDEDVALDVVAGALKLEARELWEEDATVELAAAPDEALEVEFGPCERKATTKSEGAGEGLPNWFLKWQVPAESPSKVNPTQPSVTSQMVMQAVKPPPWISVLLNVPIFVSEEQDTL